MSVVVKITQLFLHITYQFYGNFQDPHFHSLVPIPTLILGPCDASTVDLYKSSGVETSGGELCPNLTYLGMYACNSHVLYNLCIPAPVDNKNARFVGILDYLITFCFWTVEHRYHAVSETHSS